MIGETYFATRQYLHGLVTAVFQLAVECKLATGQTGDDGIDVADGFANREWMEGLLSKPIVFLACGEINGGKSALLNALAGEAICHVDPLPQIGPIRWHKYGAGRRESAEAGGVMVCEAPLDLLRCIELIDTPGTNCGNREYLEAAATLITEVDLVFVVFPISNPWGAPTWDFLGKLKPELLKKVVFSLQQCDQRDPADTPVVLGHLCDLAMKRLGEVPLVFPISVPMAKGTKRGKGGVEALENHVSKWLLESSERRQGLKDVHFQLSKMLHAIEARIEQDARRLKGESRLLDDIERDIDGMRIETLNRQKKSLGGIGEAYQCEARNASALLKKRLSVSKSVLRLFTGEDTAYAAEALIQPQLVTSIEEVAGSDLHRIIQQCHEHWAGAQERIKKVIDVEMDDVELVRKRLTESSETFVTRMGKASAAAIGDLRLRGTLDAALRSRIKGMNRLMAVTLLLVILAGLCGGLGGTVVGLCFLAAACGGLGYLSHRMSQSSSDIVEEFGMRLFHQSNTFVAAIRGDYEDGLRLFFRDYSNELESMRRHLAKENAALQPRMKQANELFLALKATEQELG